MSKLRIVTVVCLIAWAQNTLRAQQFARPPDPNLARQALEVLTRPQARSRLDPNSFGRPNHTMQGAPQANPDPFSAGTEALTPGGTASSGQGPTVVEWNTSGLAVLLDSDPNLRDAYVKYLLAYLDGERQKIDDHRSVIMATNRMGTWVFIAVHVFLAAALGVSVLEFWTAYKTRRVKRSQDEIELSFQKIALKTSMHGTVLLIISLVMYFLFLKFVYTIVLV